MPYKVHRLTEKERKYLETGDAPGSYRNHEMKRNIEEKVGMLPDRFQHLNEDIKLLSENGYLDAERWADSWLNLLNIERSQEDGYPTDVFAHSSSETESSLDYPTPAELFGHKVGEMICRLMLYPRIENEDVQLDVAWGFLEGMYELTDERIDDVLPQLEERSKQTQETTEQVLRGLRTFRQETQVIEDIRKRINNHIEDILEEEGINTSAWVIKEIRNELRKERLEFVRKEIGEEDWSVETAITPEMVNNALLENRILEKQQLREIIQTDAKRVTDKAGSPTGREVLVAIFEHKNSEVSSQEVVEELDTTKDWTSRVTRVARDLAGDKDGDREWEHRDVWEKHPVLDGNREGWKTTAYGNVLAYCLSKSSSQMIEMDPLLPLSEEDINAALDELDMDSCL